MKKLMKYDQLTDNKKEILKKLNKDFSEDMIISFYNSFVNTLSTIKNKSSIEIIEKLPTVKPIYSFQTIFNLLREFSENADDIQDDFIELKKYIGFEVDIFMLMNVIK